MKVFLLDIEGTTAPISFVHEVLFPFAKNRFSSFFTENKISQDLFQKFVNEFNKDKSEDVSLSTVPGLSFTEQSTLVPYLNFLVSKDRKFGPLKEIQGQIWKKGYEAGEIHSQIFPDVPQFLSKAKEKSIACYVYSSGSEEAQKNIYQYSPFGDLRPYFSGFFDTIVGGKKESESYSKIAESVGVATKDIYFFTDILEEASAAHVAGCTSILLDRPGNAIQPKHDYRVLKDLISFF